MTGRIYLVLGLALLAWAHSCLANDVVGCGGFVVSSVSINYAPIQIKLYTGRGLLKYATDCAPNNGYYFIPLYDTGDYVLRIEPPNGWSFDPMQVSLSYDGKTDLCSKQVDVNFVFKGFSIFGKVLSSSSTSSGPSNVQVTLLSKANKNVIKKNTTLDGGLFSFHDVLPGQYVVEASHERWTFEQNRVEVEVVKDNVHVDANSQLRVLGYSVSGKVVSDGQPINGVQFALFSQDSPSKKVPCEENTKPSFVANLPVASPMKYICSSSSNAAGVFQFKTIPAGKYVLFTFYEAQNIRFEVLPFRYEFEVPHDDLTIEALFQIGGFTVMGKVLNNLSPNERINGAQVTLIDNNDKVPATSAVVDSKTGSFSIENVKTSNYVIRTSAPHYIFDDYTFSISPNTPHLPATSPSKFEVCGKVLLQSSDSKYDNIKLVVLDKAKNSIVENVPINQQNFCLYLPGGHYILKVNSKHSEYRFVPDALDLKVQKPELEIAFEQFAAVIVGNVELMKQLTISEHHMSVNLARPDSPQKVLATSDLKPLSGNRFKFQFANILPGEYVISLNRELSNLFCWENDVKSVSISESNVDNVIFKQKGTLLQISLSHSTDLLIQSPTGKRVEILKSSIGPDRIVRHCVDEVGKYQITPRGCHKFSNGDVDTFVFDTSTQAGQMLTFTAVQHRASAHFRSASNLSDLSVKVAVQGLNEQTNKQIKLTQPVQLKSPTDQSPIYQYSLSFYESPMVNIRLEPVSSQLLFKPASFEFKLNDDCQEDVITFNGRFGVFIEGLIKPKIENVSISVFDGETNDLIFTTYSDSEGRYSGGPFDDDVKLNIEAVKDGFVLKPVANKLGHFEAHELCSIFTKIVDQNGEPLNEVLVSLSGGENNFRKNSVVNVDGTLHFENLHPGQYFMRFMRKEFEFEPASKMVTVSSGAQHVTQVVGKKVAFSAFGVVDSLNREPESAVLVEAVGIRNVIENSALVCSQIQEQAITEPDGSYRILGLLPECQYAVRLKTDDNTNIVQSIPRLHLVRVHDNDIRDLRFIIFYKITQVDVSVRVKTNQEFVSSLNVQLFRQDEPNAIFKQSLSSSPFVFFPAIPLDHKQYTLRVDSDLSTAEYRYSPLIQPFTANQSHLHLEFEFKPTARQSHSPTGTAEHEIPTNPLYSIPLLVLALVFFYNRQLLDYFRNFAQYREQLLSLFNKRNSQANSLDGNSTKKKTKAKKVN